MLQEIIDLQKNAVAELVRQAGRKQELTFRAPTGSGKTHMMADLMNQILGQHEDVVFLVSSLSKGDLARQNYLSFCANVAKGTFPNLKPYLISTEISDEESLHIPTDYNIYVLPRDLFKKNGRLMAGPMTAFLQQLTEGALFGGMNKRIFVIKDECHQATNNLDAVSPKFFSKTFNFSATPNLKRGQQPDVEITDEAAEQAKLIKHVEFGEDTDTVEQAVCKFEQIKEQYLSLGVNPCLIIQISNKDRAEEEWLRNIRPVLDKTEHQSLKWMLIVDKDKDCDTNDDLKKLKVSKWKEYAKLPTSTIDVIIFKMVISEGWDITRACMLYQVRDTKSKQLDEQVMGRVRRNPRLLDFESLNAEQQRLAMTAWIWGIQPEGRRKSYRVSLFNDEEVQQHIQIRTVHLKDLMQHKDFDVETLLTDKPREVAPQSIFALYQTLRTADNALQDLCYRYADGNVGRWQHYMSHFGSVRSKYNRFICNYDESMEVADKPTSFPVQSYYTDNGNNGEMENWVWRRQGRSTTFSFDSEAERQWAVVLQKTARRCGEKLTSLDFEDDEARYLWGKNFLPNSDIRYEYYADGVHASYPDFVMKDKAGRIHLFEVKSVNRAAGMQIDEEQYKEKIRQLEECYLACSKKLSNYVFYLPVLRDDEWHITRFRHGERDTLTLDGFRQGLQE